MEVGGTIRMQGMHILDLQLRKDLDVQFQIGSRRSSTFGLTTYKTTLVQPMMMAVIVTMNLMAVLDTERLRVGSMSSKQVI